MNRHLAFVVNSDGIGVRVMLHPDLDQQQVTQQLRMLLQTPDDFVLAEAAANDPRCSRASRALWQLAHDEQPESQLIIHQVRGHWRQISR